MEVSTSPTQTYLVIFKDDQEAELEAIGDSQAIGLAQKQYPDQKWKLYRVSGGQRVTVCDQSPECPQGPEGKVLNRDQ